MAIRVKKVSGDEVMAALVNNRIVKNRQWMQ